MKKLILLQGAPGSGKSTMAEIIKDWHQANGHASVEIHSADDYWYTQVEPELPERYSFDSKLLGQNHIWNQRNVLAAMDNDVEVIIIDNTNIFRKHAEPYLMLANIFGYDNIDVVRVDPGLNACLDRNSKRSADRMVPPNVIEVMHGSMERLLP